MTTIPIHNGPVAPVDYEACLSAATAWADALTPDQLLHATWLHVAEDGSVLIDGGSHWNGRFPKGFAGFPLRRFPSLVAYRQAVVDEVSPEDIEAYRRVRQQRYCENLAWQAQEVAYTWQGEHWQDGRGKSDVAAIVRKIIREAVDAGELPEPADYRVSVRNETYRGIYTILIWTQHNVLDAIPGLNSRLVPFNKAEHDDGFEVRAYRIEKGFS